MSQNTPGSLGFNLSMVCALALFLAGSQAAAAGLGSLVSIERTRIKLSDGGSGISSTNFILAFSIDTAVQRDSLINYRAIVGPAFSILEEGKAKGFGLVTRHCLGFGLYRGATTRVWLGPAARLSLMKLHRAVTLSAGVGAELGLNLRVTRGFSMSISAGYHISRFGVMALGESGGSSGHQHVFGVNVAGLFLTRADRASAGTRRRLPAGAPLSR